MRLGSIQKLLAHWDEVRVLDRAAEVDGNTVSAAALVRRGQEARLLLLEHDPTYRERRQEAELRDLNDPPVLTGTNGDRLFDRGVVDPRLTADHVRAIRLGEREFMCSGSQGAVLRSGEWESMLLLTLLLQAGWEPGALAEVEEDDLYVTSIDLRGEFDALPVWDGPITLVPGEQSASRLAPVRVTVPVGEGQDIPLDIPDGPRVYLEGLDFVDPWANLEETFSDPGVLEKFTPEELAEHRRRAEESYAQFCPRGMAFPAVTYESEEDISLQFYLRDWLDAPPQRSHGAFGLILGRTEGERLGPHGLPRKIAALTDLPLDPAGIRELTIGAVRWHRRRRREPITL